MHTIVYASRALSLKVKRLLKREITVLYISRSGLTCITALAKDQWVQKVVHASANCLVISWIFSAASRSYYRPVS